MADANLAARITALQDLIKNLTTEIAAKPDDEHLSKALTDAQAELNILEGEAGKEAAASPAPAETPPAAPAAETAPAAPAPTAETPPPAPAPAAETPPAAPAAPATAAPAAPAASPPAPPAAAQPPAPAAPRPRPQLRVVPPAAPLSPAPVTAASALKPTHEGVSQGGPSWVHKQPVMVPGNVKA
jgi:Meckel syndrome type 1 protein